MQKVKLKPFVKWAGGKRQLIAEIENRMPEKFNNFIEPFVGGGSLFLHLQHKNTIINDITSDLINVYNVIKDSPKELMENLDKFEAKHTESPEEFYYATRAMDREESWENADALTKATRFIYLNKTCFNGLYRVNKSGYFNVPFNKKPEINTYDRENILAMSKFLQNGVTILEGDFEKACEMAKPGDFVFFDPPYDLLNENTFDSYTKEGFGVLGQERLAKIAHELSDRGVYVMLTNHNTPLINELYKDFTIDVVNVKRMINRNADARKGVETIIYSYKKNS